MTKTKPKKKKPTHQKVLLPPGPPKPLSAKEGAQQALALCHDLIATAGFPFDRRDQVKSALDYLELLFIQCGDIKTEAINPEVVSSPKETKLEAVSADA